MIVKSFVILQFTLLSFILFQTNNFVDGKDPEDSMNISEIIRYNGYPCEDHEVITNDGYILSMQRIPYGIQNKNSNVTRPVVLLQHGLLDSAHTWTNNLRHQSLAFILADNGYDVWLTNSRGNTYSSKHVSLDPNKSAFWNFSWDEMASYDLPAFVGYSLLKSGNASSLLYVGHSQGTQIMFAALPENQWLRQRIRAYAALAPVAYLSHVESGLKVLARFRSELEELLKIFGHGRLMSNSPLFRFLASTLCKKSVLPEICSDVIFLIVGTDVSNMNQSRVSLYVAHTPAGTSLKNIIHYAQSVSSGNFQKYDYGMKGNIEHYGTPTPPQYSVKDVGVPTALFSGGKDTLADPIDVQKLLSFLQKDNKLHKQISYYNHLDFVWGMDAYQQVYPDLVNFFKQFR